MFQLEKLHTINLDVGTDSPPLINPRGGGGSFYREGISQLRDAAYLRGFTSHEDTRRRKMGMRSGHMRKTLEGWRVCKEVPPEGRKTIYMFIKMIYVYMYIYIYI